MSDLHAARHTTMTTTGKKKTGTESDKYSLFRLVILHNTQEISIDLPVANLCLDGVEKSERVSDAEPRRAVVVFVELGGWHLGICRHMCSRERR